MVGGGRLAGGECCSSARCCIGVEAGIDAERKAIVQEAATWPFGIREDLVGLLQGQRRESDGQKISRLWSKLANVLDRADILRVDDRQVISFMVEWYNPMRARASPPFFRVPSEWSLARK
jgi:hypothetical protein